MMVRLNDEVIPLDAARVSPLDRGFLLGDGLYEGLRAFGGRVVALGRHEARLAAGLREARIPWDARALGGVCEGVLKANDLADAFIYVQVTRGVPAAGQPVRGRILTGPVRPTLFAYAVAAPPRSAYPPVPAKSAAVVRDSRWLRGHVKSISLMGSVLAAYDAQDAGADDAILIREDGQGQAWVAEATSANVVVVTATGEVVTPPLEQVPILAGVTRDLVLDGPAGVGRVEVRPVRASELAEAREIMLLGTLTMVTAITRLDGRAVGTGSPGPVALRLLETLCRRIDRGE